MTNLLSGHSLSGTHSFLSSSMTVPGGQAHTPVVLQIPRRQGFEENLLVQVLAQLGSSAQLVRICPLTVQFSK